MTWVAGIDGCPAGWLMALLDASGMHPPRLRVETSFAAVLAAPEAPSIVAVDMPIGLPDHIGPGGRGCDTAARAVLGGRQSSLFAVPARAAVLQTDYAAACAQSVLHSDPARKVSKQCFNLFPKIREIDALITPALQARVFECHPEVAFWAINGDRALDRPKKQKSRPYLPGLDQRRRLLERAGMPIAAFEAQAPSRRLAGADDLLDAAACAWVALALHAGAARQFPDAPQFDGRGLRMAIATGPALRSAAPLAGKAQMAH